MDKTSLLQADNEMFKSAMTNRSTPSCTIIPVLVYDDVGKAAEWLCRTFGFTDVCGRETIMPKLLSATVPSC